jgi:hypothetical protein
LVGTLYPAEIFGSCVGGTLTRVSAPEAHPPQAEISVSFFGYLFDKQKGDNP